MTANVKWYMYQPPQEPHTTQTIWIFGSEDLRRCGHLINGCHSTRFRPVLAARQPIPPHPSSFPTRLYTSGNARLRDYDAKLLSFDTVSSMFCSPTPLIHLSFYYPVLLEHSSASRLNERTLILKSSARMWTTISHDPQSKPYPRSATQSSGHKPQ